MIKVEVEGCIMPLKGGREGHIGSFAVSYLFLIIVSSKHFPRVFSASRDDGYRLCGVCGLVCRHSGFGGPWARV